MDCRTAQQLLPYHGRAAAELTPSDAQALDVHLAECASCAAQLQTEQQLDTHFAQAVRAVPIPIGLRQRLVRRLTLQQKAGQWRRLDRWVTAAAACILIGLGGYLVLAHQRFDKPLNMRDYGDISQPHSTDQVQDWLDYVLTDSLALPAELRDRWDFDRLNYSCIQRLHSKNVPTLVFQKQDVQTVVYLLRSGQYRPETVAGAFEPESSQNAWKLGGDGEYEYTAVVVGDEKPFLKTPDGP